MTTVADNKEFKSRMSELERLLEQTEGIKDPATRDLTGRIIQSLMDFHGAGLAAMMNYLAEAGEPGHRVMDAMAADDVVSGLLLLYNLHPLDLDSRVRLALEKVRPYLGSHGGNVRLLEVTRDGVVRLQMEGSCHGCASSALTVKNTIEQAIYERAPDVSAIQVIEGETRSRHPAPPATAAFVPLSQLIATHATQPIHQGVL